MPASKPQNPSSRRQPAIRKEDRGRSLLPSEVVAHQLGPIRTQKGWSQRALAEEMERLAGRPFHKSTVAKIETGERPATLDEVFLLALALSVSPSALMVPHSARTRVAIGDRPDVSAPAILEWLRGTSPLRATPADGGVAYTDMRSFYFGRPEWERAVYERFPPLMELVDAVFEIFTFAADERDPDADRTRLAIRKLSDASRALADSIENPGIVGISVSDLMRAVSPTKASELEPKK